MLKLACAVFVTAGFLGCAASPDGGQTPPCSSVFIFADNDGDGVGGGDAFEACLEDPTQLPPATARVGGDCDDHLPTASSLITGYADADGDHVTVSTPTEFCLPALPAGFVAIANPEDCDDTDPTVSQFKTFYADTDGDGYGDSNGAMSFCKATPPTGFALDGSDPNDGNPEITPLDADGDLIADANDCAPMDASKWTVATIYADADGDTYTTGAGQAACIGAAAPAGFSLTAFGTDCNDHDPAVANPIAAYVDADQDGFGAGSTVFVCAVTLPAGYANNNTDVCPTDPTATTTPYTTPATAFGSRLSEDVADGTSWSFLGTEPYANLINYTTNVRSDWLRMRQFGFALPAAAKVLGITASVQRLGFSADLIEVRDYEIRLYYGAASRTAISRATTTSWNPSAYEEVIYGGPSDVWGRAWTAAEVNSIAFGVGVRATMVGFPDPAVDLVAATPSVGPVTVAVTYCAQ
jgi:hypothetical protein